MIFDTHAHYDDEAFNEDRDQILSSMKDGGVGCIVNVCASVGGFGGTLELMKAYPFVYGAVGVHPDDAGIMTQDTLDEKLVWTTTGIRKRQSINSSRRCSGPRWTLPGKRSCHL